MRDIKYGAPAALNTAQPWDVPFEKRMNVLYEACLSGKKTAVYLYENPDSSTFRYRAYNMCQALENSGKWSAAYFFSYELEKLRRYIDCFSLVVAVRYRWTEALEIFLKECRFKKIKTAFDLDDMVFDTGKMKLFINTLGESLSDERVCDFWFAYFSRIDMAASLCDVCLSTNDFLAERLKNHYGKPSFVIKNFMNNEQLRVSAALAGEKRNSPYRHPFVIGYFSGSYSHRHDLDLVAPALTALMSEHREIKLKIAGYMHMPPTLGALSKERIQVTPFKDFRDLQKEIAEVDLNIAPLLDNEFTNCKSELKYFEAAAVGTVTCASPVFTYKNAITDGKNGYLCGQNDWYSMIKNLFKNGIDSNTAQNAQIHALKEYGCETQALDIEKVLVAI